MCQVGRTIKMQLDRQPFYGAECIAQAVRAGIERAREAEEPIIYLTFVPDGEPTLDGDFGCEIELLRPVGIKLAVITNGSPIWRKDVREDLMKADWVSLKVDATRGEIWRAIDRPHGHLRLAAILKGMRESAEVYEGDLVTRRCLWRESMTGIMTPWRKATSWPV